MTVTVAVLLAVMACRAPLPEQTFSGGTLAGYVTDAQGGAIAEAVVTAVDATGIVRSTRTDATGYYHLSDLSPADYVVSSEREGFARLVRERVAVREGRNLKIDFTMEVGGTTALVLVDAPTPLLEWKTATRAVNISGDLQRQLPLSSLRTWADFLQQAPGVVVQQARVQTYALHGAGNSSGVFLVDGADATSALQGSSLYSQFSRETFADIQVKTGSVDASVPLGLGPVVSIATRSGTNRLEASAAFTYQPRQWNDSNVEGGQSATLRAVQSDGSLGGPLRHDRLWMFGSLRIARNETGIPRSAQQLTYLKALAPGFTAFDNRWHEVAGFARVTGRLTAGHELLVSYNGGRSTLGGAQPNEAGNFRNLVVGGPGYYARVSSVWGPTLLTRASIGYNGKKQHNVNLQREQTGVNVYDSTFSAGGRLFGVGLLATLDASPFAELDFPVYMWTVAADARWYRAGRSGLHEVQAGVYLQPRRRNRSITGYNNGGRQLEEVVLRDPANASAGVVAFHRRIYGVAEITTTDVDTRDDAFFAQDTWQPQRRLAITAGLRVDVIRRVDRIFSATTQQSTELGPRFGVNYMLTADYRNSVQFGWNRVHDNVSVNVATAGASVAAVTDLYDLLGNGSFTSLVTPGVSAPSSNLVVDRDRYHQGYVNEVTAGYRRQLPARTSIDLSVVRRAYRDRPALVETNGIYDDAVFVGYRDESQNEIYLLTPNIWNRPIATSFGVNVSKEGAGFQLLGAYTRLWNRLAGTWQPNDPAAFIQPDAFPNRNGIGFVEGCTALPCRDADSLAGNLGSGAWRSHVAKLGLSYSGPWRLLLAAHYTLQSGPWSGPIVTRLPASDPRYGPATVTLSNGRVVSNPLATPIRFAYPTRGEGQLTLAALHILNVRLGRRLSFGDRRLELALDLLNVTNNGADQSFQLGGNQQYSPFFNRGALRQFPAAAQASARLEF